MMISHTHRPFHLSTSEMQGVDLTRSRYLWSSMLFEYVSLGSLPFLRRQDTISPLPRLAPGATHWSLLTSTLAPSHLHEDLRSYFSAEAMLAVVCAKHPRLGAVTLAWYHPMAWATLRSIFFSGSLVSKLVTHRARASVDEIDTSSWDCGMGCEIRPETTHSTSDVRQM